MPGLTQVNIELGSLINKLIRDEFDLQGHTLTGTFSRSLEAKITKATLNGFAEGYGKIVNDGIPAEGVNPKMIPGLVKYFQLRGFDENAAKKFATLTYKKWITDGVSTLASARFSKTGERHHFIERAFEKPEIDRLMSTRLDILVDDLYHKTKSETI